jgi:hypothetical protein
MFSFFFNIVTVVFVPLHLYIGYRFWQSFKFYFPSCKSTYYWLVFVLLSSSFIVARVIGTSLPAALNDMVTAFGYLWIVAMLYLFSLLVMLDLYGFISRLIGISPVYSHRHKTKFIAAILVIMVIIYGSWNTRTPRVTRYDITVPKTANELKQLKVLMISDLHLGKNISSTRLTEMIRKIGELEPDIVLIPGDIIQDSEFFKEEKMYLEFQKIKAPLGAYASLGNHEFYGGVVKDTVKLLGQGGVQVLENSCVKVAESFYIVGMNDPAAARRSANKQPGLEEIMAGIDKGLPIILLNHQPVDLETARLAGVDLQLSGHTHRGQVFPANLFTDRLFEEDWGYLKKGTLQLIVSCGIGTWGPDLRIGSKSEIVEIIISFSRE